MPKSRLIKPENAIHAFLKNTLLRPISTEVKQGLPTTNNFLRMRAKIMYLSKAKKAKFPA